MYKKFVHGSTDRWKTNVEVGWKKSGDKQEVGTSCFMRSIRWLLLVVGRGRPLIIGGRRKGQGKAT
jgi:hypothetical protein